MVTILREAGFRFVIFTDDHEPAHVHVFGDGSAKIDISGPAPRLVQADGMKAGDLQGDADRRRSTRRFSGALEEYPWLS